MFLLDTNIVSADAPGKKTVGPALYDAWLRRNHERLFMSAVSIAEIEADIARADRIGATTRAARLRKWVAAMEHFYGSRILPLGLAEARLAGAIIDRARAHDPGFEDIAIAATAVVHGLTVLTANERHFALLGVPFLNPLKELPSG